MTKRPSSLRADLKDMDRWTNNQINKTIHSLFEEQPPDLDFVPYETCTGLLLRPNFEVTMELLILERAYLLGNALQTRVVECESFPVSGVWSQGIEGYRIYWGTLYRLLNLLRFTPERILHKGLRCALFVERTKPFQLPLSCFHPF